MNASLHQGFVDGGCAKSHIDPLLYTSRDPNETLSVTLTKT